MKDRIIIQFLILIEKIKDFFSYTIWGKKTPLEIMKENDPYIYEDDE